MSRQNVTAQILQTIKEEMYAQKKVIDGTRVGELQAVLMARETSILQMKIAEMVGASIEHGAAVSADMSEALGFQIRELTDQGRVSTEKLSASLAAIDESLGEKISALTEESRTTGTALAKWTKWLTFGTFLLGLATAALVYVEWKK